MANWCNLRLLVTGIPKDLKPFRLAAGALKGRINTKRSSVFTPEMEYGEGGDLEAWGVRRFQKRFQCATFVLQGRNDDYVDHFREVSRRFPTLVFVLVYSDPNGDDHGSYLLRNGRQRAWTVPARTREAIVRREYIRMGAVDEKGDVDYDGEGADTADWVAFSAMMDVAERKWDTLVLESVESRAKPKPAIRGKRRRLTR